MCETIILTKSLILLYLSFLTFSLKLGLDQGRRLWTSSEMSIVHTTW